jgi:hypothetical protein
MLQWRLRLACVQRDGINKPLEMNDQNEGYVNLNLQVLGSGLPVQVVPRLWRRQFAVGFLCPLRGRSIPAACLAEKIHWQHDYQVQSLLTKQGQRSTNCLMKALRGLPRSRLAVSHVQDAGAV